MYALQPSGMAFHQQPCIQKQTVGTHPHPHSPGSTLRPSQAFQRRLHGRQRCQAHDPCDAEDDDDGDGDGDGDGGDGDAEDDGDGGGDAMDNVKDAYLGDNDPDDDLKATCMKTPVEDVQRSATATALRRDIIVGHQ